MPSIVYDSTSIISVSSVIVTGVGTALTAIGAPVGRSVITEGEVAWDYCDCGQLALTILDSAPSLSFPPTVARRSNQESAFFVANMELSLVRCVPVSDVNGNPPAEADLLANAIAVENDRYTVRTALLCILEELKRTTRWIHDYTVTTCSPLGPSGGCGGLSFAIRIAWIDCIQC